MAWQLGFLLAGLLVPGVGGIQSASATDELERGRQLFLEGRFGDASRLLRTAAESHPDAADRLDARLLLALIAQARGDDARVVRELQWALVEDPDLALDPNVYSEATRSSFERAREQAFDRLLEAKRHFAAGEIELALEEFRLSAALMEKDVAEAAVENRLDAYLSAALIYQTLGNDAAARDAFRDALHLRPELHLDTEFYSPSTVAMFRSVKNEGPERLTAARTAIRSSNLRGALDILTDAAPRLIGARQKTEAQLLGAYITYLRDERDDASALLETVFSESPDVPLDENFYRTDFVALSRNVRLVVTRGLPKVAIVQSSSTAVHNVARDGFVDATIAQHELFVLPEDAPSFQSGRESFELVFALGDEAYQFVTDCCASMPIIGGNLTTVQVGPSNAPRGGVSWHTSAESQVPVAMRALPGLSRVGALVGPGRGRQLASELRAALSAYDVSLVVEEIESERDVDDALESLLDQVELFWYFADPALASVEVFERIRSECDRARKPIFAFHESLVQSGAFLSVSADFAGLGRRAGRMAVSYLENRSADTLRVVPGDASRVVLNLGTATRLGVQLDPNFVSLAATLHR